LSCGVPGETVTSGIIGERGPKERVSKSGEIVSLEPEEPELLITLLVIANPTLFTKRFNKYRLG